MPIPTLTSAPTAPSRINDNPADYVTKADAFIAWMEDHPTELNAWATAVAAVVSGVDFNGTSTTSLAIGTGSKAFTTQSGKLWQIGQFVIAASTATPANYMYGQVTAYSSTTLTVNVTAVGGSGTLNDWAIGIAPNASSYATQAGAETLTNKTIALGSNSLSGSLAEFNAALTAADFASLAGSETLTNKTINLTSNTLVSTLAQLNAAVSDADVASLAGTETLTNKTINLTSNTLSGTTAQFNAALSDGDFATQGGTETLTNKTLTSPTINTPIVTGGTYAGGTFTDPAITGCILEDIYTITDGAAFEIDPGNGSIQRITLGANRTPKATNMANGESVLLLVADGTAYTITWTDATFGGSGVSWLGSVSGGGSAPTLGTTGLTWIILTKYSGQVYGQLAGYSG